MLPEFNVKSKYPLLTGAAVCLFVAARCFWLWQPERQVLLHQRHFLDAVGDRKWKKIEAFLADDFRDRFGHDKAWALRESKEVLRHFFALTIEDSETAASFTTPEGAGPNMATVTAFLKLAGSGTALAEYAKSEVNRSREPFTFAWRKQSWKPWDWQLTTVDHPLVGRGEWQ